MDDSRPETPDAVFAAAAEALRALTFRADFAVREIPAPSSLAPHALALAGDVRPEEEGIDSPYGTGRVVVLYDPASPDAWDGPWRLVCFAQAPLEPEIGTDPLLADVAWSWLMDALESRGAGFHAASGTATKTLSKGFGGLAAEGDGAQIELRASWSPESDLSAHIDAWAELVCMLAGLPPGSEDAAVFGESAGPVAEFTLVSDRAALDRAVAALSEGTGPAAVDVERASGFRYSQRAYLIQIYRRDAGAFLLDPPALGDLAEVQAAIGGTEWILHAASQDLPSLREAHLEPPSIFDTELAARLLGHERVGLGAVVEDALGITLAKAHSAADWSTRPLPESWLEYAALDVLYLVDVKESLEAELAEQHKTEIAAQEFEAVRTRPPKPPREDPWRRLSGLHTVRGRRAMAVASALWTAREEYAQEQDIAPGRLVPDRALVAAIAADPATKQELARLSAFTGRASRSQLDRWWAAIEKGRAETTLPPERIPGDALPPPRVWGDRNPAADRRLKAARPAVEALAEQLRMPTENLLTPDTLRRLAWNPPEPVTTASVADALTSHGVRPWQRDYTASVIADAFVASVHEGEEAAPTAS